MAGRYPAARAGGGRGQGGHDVAALQRPTPPYYARLGRDCQGDTLNHDPRKQVGVKARRSEFRQEVQRTALGQRAGVAPRRPHRCGRLCRGNV